jgi:hypothetical protein
MPVKLACPCGQVLTVEEGSGSVLCPHCQRSLALPAPPENLPDPETCQLREEVFEIHNIEVIEEEEGDTSYAVEVDDRVVHQFAATGALTEMRLKRGSITRLAYGPDDATALAADDQDLYFLDLKARTWTPTRPMHGDEITCLTFSPGGRLALSGDGRGGLLLWDVLQKKPLRWLNGHRSEVRTGAFAPDGTSAATAGTGGLVRLWHMPSGKPLSLDDAQFDDYVTGLCFAPDGRLLMAVGENGTARLGRLPGGEPAGKLAKGSDYLHSLAFTRDGASVLAGSRHRFKVCKWDLPTGERRPCFRGFADRLPNVRKTWVSSDGYRLLALSSVVVDRGGRERSDDPASLGLAGSVLAFTGLPLLAGGSLAGGAIVPGTAVWAGSKGASHVLEDILAPSKPGYQLQLWNVMYESAASVVFIGVEPPDALACSADGHRVLVGFEDGRVQLYGL